MSGIKHGHACRWCLIFSLWCGALSAGPLQDLTDESRYQEAYELARAQLDDNIGEPQFDFLYGLAALETGHPQEALFAFERVLAMQPENHRARLELARAHYALGNFETAKLLFEEVRAVEPPPQVKSNINLFLEQIEQQKDLGDSRLTRTVTISAGVDSNVNSATSISSVDTPLFGSIALSEASRASNDEFAELNLSVDYLKLLRKDLGYFAGVSFDGRKNSTYDTYDTRQLGVNGGIAYQVGRHGLRFPIQLSRLDVDNIEFRKMSTLGLEWSTTFTPLNQSAVFLQGGQMRYPTQQIRDADMMIAGAAWSSQMENMPLTLFVSGFYGDEDTKQSSGEFHARDYTGLRFGGIYQAARDHQLSLTLLGQQIEHKAINPIFQQIREDDLSQATLKWDWKLYPEWTLAFTVDYTKNKSNLDLYTYSRTQEYLSLTYSF